MQIDELRAEFQTLVARYGLTSPPELRRILSAEDRRRYRMRHLQGVIEEAQAELGLLRTEIDGLTKGMRLALQDAISTARADHNEGWSPVPVIGYRVWNITEKGIFGYRVQWETSKLSAKCGQGMGTDEVPHTDGRCGPPACGIYASKIAASVIQAHPGLDSWMVGMVELSGKVVEHELGYRAQHAEATAVMAFEKRGAFVSDDPAEIDGLFRWPDRRYLLTRITRPVTPTTDAAAYFAAVNKRREPWT